MKSRITIMPILLLAFVASCQKAEIKDEEMQRLLIGTWVSEGWNKLFDEHWQTRNTFKSDGTVQRVIYKWDFPLLGKRSIPMEHRWSLVLRNRYLRAIGEDATVLPKITTETWRIENGSLSSTTSIDGESSRDVINELTATRLVVTREDFGKTTFVKLSRWNRMTDAEISAYHKEREKNHQQHWHVP